MKWVCSVIGNALSDRQERQRMTVTFCSELAEIRFGCGLSPVVAAPSSVADMLDGLNGPDDMARRFPITPFSDYSPRIGEFRDIRIRQRRLDDPDAALKLQRSLCGVGSILLLLRLRNC